MNEVVQYSCLYCDHNTMYDFGPEPCQHDLAAVVVKYSRATLLDAQRVCIERGHNPIIEICNGVDNCELCQNGPCEGGGCHNACCYVPTADGGYFISDMCGKVSKDDSGNVLYCLRGSCHPGDCEYDIAAVLGC